MSYVLQDASLKIPGIKYAEKIVLIAIASHADADGKCWPSVGTLAELAGMGVRTANRHIASLIKKGYIRRIYRTGRSAVTWLTDRVMCFLTPANQADRPLPIRQTESAIESVNEITAQAAAPMLAENPAVAAVVVFESVDTEAMDTPPVVDLVPALPVIDNPLADVPAALLDDFGIVRKAKKKAAKVTRLEGQVMAREAAKARLTVEDVVKLCILRGWSRFEAVFATPAVMTQFYATMTPAQAPQTGRSAVYVHEAAPPANPDIIRIELAKIATQPGPTAKMADPLAWAKNTLARHQAGEHVSGFALRSARAALRL